MNDRKIDEYIKRLKRRAEHLEQRISEDKTNSNHYDRAELSALTWTLRYVEDTYESAMEHQCNWFQEQINGN